MRTNNNLQTKEIICNKLFIVENRNLWPSCKDQCQIDTDIILCTDFALKLDLISEGYQVYFLDQIGDRELMQQYNFQMHFFLNTWFKSGTGENLLMYNDFNIGDALLLNIYNDVTYFCHFFFNLLLIKRFNYQTLYVCVEENLIKDILTNILNIEYTEIKKSTYTNSPIYSFPISQWMNEKISRTSLKSKLIDLAACIFDNIFFLLDSIFRTKKQRIYIQGYYPTFKIINELKRDKEVSLILGNYTGIKTIYKERRIFFSDSSVKVNIDKILKNFTNADKSPWVIDGYAISDYLYQYIIPIVAKDFNTAIVKAKSIKSFLDKNPIKLMIPITNLWLNNRLIMNYCKNNNVPIFMIINGLLNVDFSHDAKDSDWVNCYSQSIKKEYFNNSENAIPLGDPRMDFYATADKKSIDRNEPTIIIGAAGFDLTDLNSYLGYEFDFLYDILKAISVLREQGRKNKVILKVRANGYLSLYKEFCNEYYPELEVKFEQNSPFKDVIKEADLYITFYSQTVFEASTIGIPVIFYKKDTQYVHAPFNGDSELVTSLDTEDLIEKIEAFYQNDDCFNAFLDKKIMEKYIGSLDGKNTQRNIDFIYSLIQPN